MGRTNGTRLPRFLFQRIEIRCYFTVRAYGSYSFSGAVSPYNPLYPSPQNHNPTTPQPHKTTKPQNHITTKPHYHKT